MTRSIFPEPRPRACWTKEYPIRISFDIHRWDQSVYAFEYRCEKCGELLGYHENAEEGLPGGPEIASGFNTANMISLLEIHDRKHEEDNMKRAKNRNKRQPKALRERKKSHDKRARKTNSK